MTLDINNTSLLEVIEHINHFSKEDCDSYKTTNIITKIQNCSSKPSTPKKGDSWTEIQTSSIFMEPRNSNHFAYIFLKNKDLVFLGSPKAPISSEALFLILPDITDKQKTNSNQDEMQKKISFYNKVLSEHYRAKASKNTLKSFLCPLNKESLEFEVNIKKDKSDFSIEENYEGPNKKIQEIVKNILNSKKSTEESYTIEVTSPDLFTEASYMQNRILPFDVSSILLARNRIFNFKLDEENKAENNKRKAIKISFSKKGHLISKKVKKAFDSISLNPSLLKTKKSSSIGSCSLDANQINYNPDYFTIIHIIMDENGLTIKTLIKGFFDESIVLLNNKPVSFNITDLFKDPKNFETKNFKNLPDFIAYAEKSPSINAPLKSITSNIKTLQSLNENLKRSLNINSFIKKDIKTSTPTLNTLSLNNPPLTVKNNFYDFIKEFISNHSLKIKIIVSIFVFTISCFLIYLI